MKRDGIRSGTHPTFKTIARGFTLSIPSGDKTQATLLSTFEQLYAYVERQFGICIQTFMMDHEPGLGKEFDNWAQPLGIRVENSAVDTPD